jgi:hypothetical protein
VEEWRDNYRILYFRIDGSLEKVVSINDFRQYLDYHIPRRTDNPTRIISVNKNLIAKIKADGRLTFEDLVTKKSSSHPDAKWSQHNNKFLVTRDFRVFDLAEGKLKEYPIPQPWTDAKVFGSYLAVTSPTTGVSIVNLENEAIEFSEQSEDVPKNICGFMHNRADDDFLAVQYDRYIKVWHQAQKNHWAQEETF